jgi:uncharacterized protein (DUF2267 family)
MNYKEFVGQVQHRLELAEMGAAVRATRATLTTLGERLQEGEATDAASPLPPEIGRFVAEADHGQRFDYDGFLGRVAERGEIDKPDANYQAQQVVALVSEVVPPGNTRKIHDQLPEEYEPLFEFVEEQGQR